MIKPLTEKFKKTQIPSMKIFYKTPLSISLILALSANSIYAVCAPNQDKNSYSNQENSPLFLSKDIANNPYFQKNQTYSENFMQETFDFTTDGESLILQGGSNTIGIIKASNTGTNGNTLILDSTANTMMTSIENVVNGQNLILDFKGNSTNTNTLSLKTTDLKDLKVTSGTNNTLVFKGQGMTKIHDTTDITVGNGAGITFDLSSGSGLYFKGNFITNAGATSTFIAGVNSIIRSDTINSGSVVTNRGEQNFVFNTNNASLRMINKNGELDKISTTTSGAITNIIFNSPNTFLIASVETSGARTNIEVAQNMRGNILGKISTSGDGTYIVLRKGAALGIGISSEHINAGGSSISTITSEGDGAMVDLAMTEQIHTNRSNKLLAINTEYSGTTTFNLYVDPKTNRYDQINLGNIVDPTKKSGTIAFSVVGNTKDILASSNNEYTIFLGAGLRAENQGVTYLKIIEEGISYIGYEAIKTIAKEKDKSGEYYLYKAYDLGILPEIQKVISTALSVSYDLYSANFNSLNKRMGELRDNPYTQGVWGRIFGGAMDSEFGSGSKSNYVTLQAGYDYAFSFDDARNYLGASISYGNSSTKGNILSSQANHGSIGLQEAQSDLVEVGIYNTYIADSGWYNDSIFKLGAVMSSLTLNDNLSQKSDTNNFTMILSDEFGYRYKFGRDQSWYVDPQMEVGFGYFGGSEINRVMESSGAVLNAKQEGIFTLRSRIGANLGKRFQTEKGFALLYLGASYEYDLITGGKIEAISQSGNINTPESMQSNGRVILNIGSDIALSEDVRMYIDVEKSFTGKQTTFMEFNLGARYSFGEKNSTTLQNNTSRAPHKLSSF